jgi:hypothetical protein
VHTCRATLRRLRQINTMSAATAARGLSSLPNQACLKPLRLICGAGEGEGPSQMPNERLHSGRHRLCQALKQQGALQVPCTALTLTAHL